MTDHVCLPLLELKMRVWVAFLPRASWSPSLDFRAKVCKVQVWVWERVLSLPFPSPFSSLLSLSFNVLLLFFSFWLRTSPIVSTNLFSCQGS